jgi:hypothetical protein
LKSQFQDFTVTCIWNFSWIDVILNANLNNFFSPSRCEAILKCSTEHEFPATRANLDRRFSKARFSEKCFERQQRN